MTEWVEQKETISEKITAASGISRERTWITELSPQQTSYPDKIFRLD